MAVSLLKSTRVPLANEGEGTEGPKGTTQETSRYRTGGNPLTPDRNGTVANKAHVLAI